MKRYIHQSLAVATFFILAGSPALAAQDTPVDGEADFPQKFFHNSYLGALLSGREPSGIGVLDLLVIGLILWLLLKKLTPGRPDRGAGPDRTPGAPGQPPAHEDSEVSYRERTKEEVERRVKASWDHLSGKGQGRSGSPWPGTPAKPGPGGPPASPPAPTENFGPPAAGPLPAGFDSTAFLEGARAMFARVQASWDVRDFEDLAFFTTPEMFKRLEYESAENFGLEHKDILLINAKVLEVRQVGLEEKVRTFFDVILSGGKSGQSTVREIWTFSRQINDPDSVWKLDAIEQSASEKEQAEPQ